MNVFSLVWVGQFMPRPFGLERAQYCGRRLEGEHSQRGSVLVGDVFLDGAVFHCMMRIFIFNFFYFDQF